MNVEKKRIQKWGRNSVAIKLSKWQPRYDIGTTMLELNGLLWRCFLFQGCNIYGHVSKYEQKVVLDANQDQGSIHF